MSEDKDTQPRRLDGAANQAGREDDRNVELDESPVPDPEQGEPTGGDDPEAD